MSYDPNFYTTIRSGTVKSAEIVVPYIVEQIKPKTVVDVGGGEGHWGHKFQELGCEVLGIDGAYVKGPVIPFKAIDLEQPFTIDQVFDLAVCLEVAEHLKPQRAKGFVADLCKLAPTILFSAAIPGQGGNGHINCMWPDYWEELFAEHGYSMNGSIRDMFWYNEDIEPWYRQNAVIASNESDKYPELFKLEANINRVHPIIASWNGCIKLP